MSIRRPRTVVSYAPRGVRTCPIPVRHRRPNFVNRAAVAPIRSRRRKSGGRRTFYLRFERFEVIFFNTATLLTGEHPACVKAIPKVVWKTYGDPASPGVIPGKLLRLNKIQ